MAVYLFAQSVDVRKGLVAGRIFKRSRSSGFLRTCLRAREKEGRGWWVSKIDEHALLLYVVLHELGILATGRAVHTGTVVVPEVRGKSAA